MKPTALRTIIGCLAIIPLTIGAQTPPTTSAKPPRAHGPLRVHPLNPLYFTDGTTNSDGSLKAVYLAGHQIFVDLQDNAFNKEWTKDMSRPEAPAGKTRLLDWDRYLDWVEHLNFNYLRGWIIWSTGSGTAAPPHRVASSMPFPRTGPGRANDGQLKFDLARFDEDFFKRLRDRARALQERGVYFSVMLFELYGFLDGEDVNGQRLWEGNVFHPANHINGLNVDRNRNRLGEEFFSLDNTDVVKLQKTYIEKMVDVLNDLDNVLWEICNEAPTAALDWQLEMLRHLKAYESRKPKQHLILLSPGGWVPGGWRWPPEEQFTQSPADFIATANGWINKTDPKVCRDGKPVIMDMDHVGPGDHEPSLIWKAFTRGYHFSLYETPFEQPEQESPAWQTARENLKLTRVLAQRVENLARLNPREDLASTGYSLADAGQTYVIYAPKQVLIEVHGLEPGRKYRGEWFNTSKAAGEATIPIITSSNATLRLQPPCDQAVLFLTAARGPEQKPDSERYSVRLQEYSADPQHRINEGMSTIDLLVFDTTKRVAHLSRGTSYRLEWRTFTFSEQCVVIPKMPPCMSSTRRKPGSSTCPRIASLFAVHGG